MLDQFSNSLLNNVTLKELLNSARLVIFDLNGLIIDDEGVQFQAAQKALTPLGIDLTEQYWISSCVGHRANEYFSKILGEEGDPTTINKLVIRKNELYRTLVANSLQSIVRPNIRELMDLLICKGSHSLALSTSAMPAEVDIILGKNGLDLLRHFHFTVNGAEVSKPKPDPETYLRVLTQAASAPEEALALEDSAVGVASAVNANIPVIAVPNRFTKDQDFSSAKLVFF